MFDCDSRQTFKYSFPEGIRQHHLNYKLWQWKGVDVGGKAAFWLSDKNLVKVLWYI